MDRSQLLKMWDESWGTATWVAPWEKAVSGLTAAQANWKPAAGRHSIWQNVNHVCIWREFSLTKIDGRPGPKREEMDALNFAEPSAPTEAEWANARERLKRTHDDFHAVIAGPAKDLERAYSHLPHDAYHLGQIMLLRALQGLPPIE